jgi:hypothetical protein
MMADTKVCITHKDAVETKPIQRKFKNRNHFMRRHIKVTSAFSMTRNTVDARFSLRYITSVQSVPQQDVHGLTMCSWGHFESKNSNKHGSDLQRFVKKITMSSFFFFLFFFLLQGLFPTSGEYVLPRRYGSSDTAFYCICNF